MSPLRPLLRIANAKNGVSGRHFEPHNRIRTETNRKKTRHEETSCKKTGDRENSGQETGCQETPDQEACRKETCSKETCSKETDWHAPEDRSRLSHTSLVPVVAKNRKTPELAGRLGNKCSEACASARVCYFFFGDP